MELSVFSDEYYMQQALNEALRAEENDEVPVGAVIVCNDKIIARAHNQAATLLPSLSLKPTAMWSLFGTNDIRAFSVPSAGPTPKLSS